MGRYSQPLATEFLAATGVQPGWHALDVGCGPGALTVQLVERLGSAAVTAIDPSESFIEAIRARLPEVDVRRGVAEQLPFPDNSFDLALTQLVVLFMADPVAGLAEMARVTRPGGVVGACVWDHAGGGGPLSLFWDAVRGLDPLARDESAFAGSRGGHLVELFESAGMHRLDSSLLSVRVRFESVDEWWEPYTLGVGPAGDYVAQLSNDRRAQLLARCTELLPPAPFDIEGRAWTVLAHI